MAKKKGKKGKSGKGGSGKVDFNEALGIGGGVYGGHLLDKIEFLNTLDPKMKAGVKILLGAWGKKQKFVRNLVSGLPIDGIGSGVTAVGWDELLTEMDMITGAGSRMGDDEDIAVVVDGIDDVDVDYDGENDDEFGEDVLGEDLDTVNDDLDTVNEDVMGDDDEY